MEWMSRNGNGHWGYKGDAEWFHAAFSSIKHSIQSGDDNNEQLMMMMLRQSALNL